MSAATTTGETVPVDDPPAPATGADGGSRRRFGLAMVVVALVAGVLVGYATGLVTPSPSATTTGGDATAPGDTSPEAGFARDMTAHHAQAVDMGVTALARATTPEVRNLGMDIALTQQSEIGMMQQWLRDWDLLPSGTEPAMAWMDEADAVVDGRMPGMATHEEMDQLRELDGTEVDRLFLELMITHHLGGIHMVDGVLDRSDHPEVTWLAGAQKDAQSAEIQIMQDLLERLDDNG